ncbi:hypothetical protein JDV02_000786 [Purpureocillium takamizusanense]|uniref:Short chain dehydrogenase n=1 Tax=Purpureocillium takamizusanense TaxID=2060973 RepID=A0A9Q8V5W3_9HYPO|nr:uncharacterized protein JDV02_000786 [Purpureocillium takamizusanense]UNI14118.1 hypothetical protein JDV02_000786 [Purpureocillium takamizusanense]
MAPASSRRQQQQPVALVVGASRGIGRQVAIDLAKNGYAVVVAAKTVSDPSKLNDDPFPPNPNSPASTITTVAREITAAGGVATAIPVDVRSEQSVNDLVARTVEAHGRLDALVYNSGAIFWASVADTPLKRFQLMQRVNPEGLYAVVQAALPHLRRAPVPSSLPGGDGAAGGVVGGGRIVVVSPPIYSRFFRGKTAYAMGKVGMSVLTKGLAMDLLREGERSSGMAITSIWPAVAIESAATAQFTKADPSEAKDLRRATIFSDAILAILRAPPSVVNGELLLDEDFLRDHAGVSDFAKYSVVSGSNPRRIMPAKLPDLTVAEQDDEGKRHDSTKKSRL